MNDMTPTIYRLSDGEGTRYCPADLLQKLDRDIHPWLLSEREGSNRTTLSYVKVDILTDTLNKLFGPLGWGVEAEIQKMDDFQYDKPGYQNAPSTEMYVFQVISQVKLTIKPQTETGTPTVFVQSGIGYGEVKINGHRKDAVGMAVKGAESDGLKRCCNLLGRALGMFLVGGKQDPVVYAHNGNKNRQVVQRALRDRAEHQERHRDDASGRDRFEDVDREDPRGRNRDDRNDERRREPRARDDRDDERRLDVRGHDARADERRRESRPRDDRDEAPRREQRERDDRSRNPEDDRRTDRSDRPRESVQTSEQQRGNSAGPASADRPASSDRSAAPTGDGRTTPKAEKTEAATPEVKNSRRANTNYDLRKVPVTRDNQTDFGATFIRQLEGMRQIEDQEQMVKNYAQRINELDPDVRALIVERLRERQINVALLD
ncbi:Rad52/Rad22 family DNA repair protein [Sphingomonas sp. 3-13AW]|uniref:Rad52/Rad22 family DNA repair protein n=1 Tax=Sphingomonas sp. 3-13AW TaxID=3050450 RepID=UPI003BB68FB3